MQIDKNRISFLIKLIQKQLNNFFITQENDVDIIETSIPFVLDKSLRTLSYHNDKYSKLGFFNPYNSSQ